MKNLKKKLSYAIYTLTALVCLSSCQNKEPKNQRKMFVWLKYDSGMDFSNTKIYCDSVQMVAINEAYIFIDGVKQKVIAHRVRPCSN